MLPPSAPPVHAFLVLPENWQTVLVFLGVQRRWDRNPWSGAYIAINTPAMECTMRMRRVPARDQSLMFEDLLAMETAALPLLNKGQ